MNALSANLAKMVDIGASGATHIGLLGRGIGASLSPAMHRREGLRQGLDYHYHLIDFDALGLVNSDLADVVTLLEKIGFSGLNVTHPFKQAILPHLTALSPDAAAIGAVNTVLLRDEGREGHNTDCWGFAESFRAGLGQARRDTVLQLGAGGAGAAVAHALLELGVTELAICDVDTAKAQALATQLARPGIAISAVTDAPAVLGRCDGIVNTTPVGMDKYPGTPIDPALLATSQWVADIIYFPRITQLLIKAEAKGCTTLPGAGMAVFQAVKAFTLFTGRIPSSQAMTETFETAA